MSDGRHIGCGSMLAIIMTAIDNMLQLSSEKAGQPTRWADSPCRNSHGISMTPWLLDVMLNDDDALLQCR